MFKVGDKVRIVNMPNRQEWYDERGAGTILRIDETSPHECFYAYSVKFKDIHIPYLFYSSHLLFHDYYEDFRERMEERLR